LNQPRQTFPHEEIVRTVAQRILQPLVRLLIRKGYTVQWLSEEIKHAYINVAVDELERREEPRISNSRLNLMTGIQRPEVKRIRSAIEAKSITVIHPIALLISLWHGEATDSKGRVLDLPRTATDKDQPSFFAFADRATNKNVAQATFLQECIQKGIVRHDLETDRVHLLEDAFIPTKAFEEQLHFFAENQGDHVDAGVENILAESPRYFDRSVLYKGFAEEDVEALDKLSRDLAMKALHAVNKEARKRAKSGRKGRFRFNLGIFSFFREQPPNEPR